MVLNARNFYDFWDCSDLPGTPFELKRASDKAVLFDVENLPDSRVDLLPDELQDLVF